MPRPAPFTKIPPFLTPVEQANACFDDYLKSLSDADLLAFLNAIRSGAAFNFTPTS